MNKTNFELVDNEKRGKLHEGINRGMGFQFCKREKQKLIALQPLSPCKDYLNEIVYTENTGKPSSAHGLSVNKKNAFEKTCAYLVFGICKQGATNGSEYDTYNRDCGQLEKNHNNLEKFLNLIEKKIGLKIKSKIIRLKENRVLSILPLFWVKNTYLISVYSLLIRAGYFYEGGDIIEFLQNFDKVDNDRYLLQSALPKIQNILNGQIPEQDMSKIRCPHNLGIISYNATKAPASKPIATTLGEIKMIKTSI